MCDIYIVAMLLQLFHNLQFALSNIFVNLIVP